MILDEWQKEVLKTEGNMILCSGRQVGKSTIVAVKSGEFCCKNNNVSLLIISATERQAEELFIKCLNYISQKYPNLISKGKDRPTKHLMRLKNGSVLRCLPTGIAGIGIRGFTINGLIADECAYINEDVWTSVTPMLMTTGGWQWLLSTPHGKAGYFYDRYNDPTFKIFHVNSEEVITNRDISANWSQAQREGALAHLERAKKTMSSRQFAQEYMGQFIDSLMSFFPDNLIKSCMNVKKGEIVEGTAFCGIDVARLGDDQGTWEIIKKVGDRLIHVESVVTTKTRLNETFNKTLELDRKYNFKRIYIDDGGIGVGVFDYLLEHDQTKRKVVAINNRARPLDRDETRNKKILKEDLYNNLLMLMETGRISLLEDDELIQSMKSVQYEYVTTEGQLTKLRIFGNYTHIVEGLIRSAWCVKEKGLNLWVR